MNATYVHGYSERESQRLADQAGALARLLHCDTVYSPRSLVLEAGCGTGAQTAILTSGNSATRFVSIDRSANSLTQARSRVATNQNVVFAQGDIFDLPFPDAAFDHVFVCFVLEHLAQPEEALDRLLRVLKPGGSLTAIEGDHGSWYCYPESAAARQTVQCLIDVQARNGGDSLIGRRLYPLLKSVALDEVRVSPRMVYVDSSRPELVEGFSKNTFIAMVEGVRDEALRLGMIDPATWRRGIADMYRATQPDGTFCYTFFRGIGIRR